MANPTNNPKGPKGAARARVAMVTAGIIGLMVDALSRRPDVPDLARVVFALAHDLAFHRSLGSDVASAAVLRTLTSRPESLAVLVNVFRRHIQDPDIAARGSVLFRALCTDRKGQLALVRHGLDEILKDAQSIHMGKYQTLQYCIAALAALSGPPADPNVVLEPLGPCGPSEQHNTDPNAPSPSPAVTSGVSQHDASGQATHGSGTPLLRSRIPAEVPGSVGKSAEPSPCAPSFLGHVLHTDVPELGPGDEWFDTGQSPFRTEALQAERAFLAHSDNIKDLHDLEQVQDPVTLLQRLRALLPAKGDRRVLVVVGIRLLSQLLERCPASRTAVIEVGAVTFILRLMRTQPPVFEYHHAGLVLLYRLVGPQDETAAVAARHALEENAIAVLTFTIRAFISDPEVTGRAICLIQILCQLLEDDVTVDQLTAWDTIRWVAEGMKVHPNNPPLLSAAVRCLAYLAPIPAHRGPMFQARVVECVGAALRVFLVKRDLDGIEAAMQCLCWLCSGDMGAPPDTPRISDYEKQIALNAALFVIHKCPDSLSICTDALKILGHVTKFESGRARFTTPEGAEDLTRLVGYLQQPTVMQDPNAAFAGVLVLCYLANAPQNQVLFARLRVVPLLVALVGLHPAFEELVLHAILTIGLILGVDDSQRVDAVTQHGVLRVVDLVLGRKVSPGKGSDLTLECAVAILWQVWNQTLLIHTS